MSDPHLDELWQRVLASFGDDAAHTAFLDHARLTGQLGEAAARYRDQVKGADAYRDEPGRAEIARKRLAAVAILAMADMEASRSNPAPASLQSAVRWAASLLMFAFVIYLMVRFMAR